MQTIEAKAVLSAADKTGGVFAGIAAKIKTMNDAARRSNETAARASRTAANANRTMASSVAGANDGMGLGIAAIASRVAGPAAIAAAAYKAAQIATDQALKHAKRDQAMTYTKITGDASEEDKAAAQEMLMKKSRELGVTYDKLQESFDKQIAAGDKWAVAMQSVPLIAKAAKASNADPNDLSTTARAGRRLGVDDQTMLDMAAFSGKQGSFELKDMAHYIPALAPRAEAAGIKGTRDVADFLSFLQIMREGAGTAEQANVSAENWLQKRDNKDTKFALEEVGMDFDKEMKKASKSGMSYFEAWRQTMQKGYEAAQKKGKNLDEFLKPIGDQQYKLAATALISSGNKMMTLSRDLQEKYSGTVDRDNASIQKTDQSQIDRIGTNLTAAGDALGTLTLAAAKATGALDGMEAGASRAADGMTSAANFFKQVSEKGFANAALETAKTAVQAEADAVKERWTTGDPKQQKSLKDSILGSAYMGPLGMAAGAGQWVGNYAREKYTEKPADFNDRFYERPADFNDRFPKADPSYHRASQDLPPVPLPRERPSEAPAKQEVSVDVQQSTPLTGSVDVNVKIDASGVAQALAAAKAELSGALRNMQSGRGGNGPGSTGVSSPDARPNTGIGGR